MSSPSAFSSLKRRVTKHHHAAHKRASSASSALSTISSASSLSEGTPPASPPALSSLPKRTSSLSDSAPPSPTRLTDRPPVIPFPELAPVSFAPTRPAPPPPAVPPRTVAPWRAHLLAMAQSYSCVVEAGAASNNTSSHQLTSTIGRLADPRLNERQALAVLRSYLDTLHSDNASFRPRRVPVRYTRA
ncbi:uncharacterized protein LOC62_06G007919 [Vanrija pseudolonga]|uniref:Uncharacterized protein n=1 Tax=Vanrija pseudolonga TaxID=143232 RepID=A0AAF0YIX6_9TREE|nr:hypothetical protein LOC62_06G007919 [Vanrija pseudolonga]